MRSTGRDHGIENRWVDVRLDLAAETEGEPAPGDRSGGPRPALASVIGVRAKAMATAVPSSIVSVCSAATASGMNGSCFASNENARSYPSSSSLR